MPCFKPLHALPQNLTQGTTNILCSKFGYHTRSTDGQDLEDGSQGGDDSTVICFSPQFNDRINARRTCHSIPTQSNYQPWLARPTRLHRPRFPCCRATRLPRRSPRAPKARKRAQRTTSPASRPVSAASPLLPPARPPLRRARVPLPRRVARARRRHPPRNRCRPTRPRSRRSATGTKPSENSRHRTGSPGHLLLAVVRSRRRRSTRRALRRRMSLLPLLPLLPPRPRTSERNSRMRRNRRLEWMGLRAQRAITLSRSRR
ncbi:hypothetical protein OF83DRAFT_1096005 [Amylostereum chailletii]|nr:hypothetical protein OF83DRAFT_1096005 [Amylostereum chailletii]